MPLSHRLCRRSGSRAFQKAFPSWPPLTTCIRMYFWYAGDWKACISRRQGPCLYITPRLLFRCQNFSTPTWSLSTGKYFNQIPPSCPASDPQRVWHVVAGERQHGHCVEARVCRVWRGIRRNRHLWAAAGRAQCRRKRPQGPACGLARGRVDKTGPMHLHGMRNANCYSACA